MIETAAFSFKSYRFDKVIMDFSAFQGNEFKLNILPSGILNLADKTFTLEFLFFASMISGKSEEEQNVLEIHCVSMFEFKNVSSIEDIPDYFYTNSLAIVFPYVRAFVSNVTLQANIKPIVLPTMNLTGLKDLLKKNVRVK